MLLIANTAVFVFFNMILFGFMSGSEVRELYVSMALVPALFKSGSYWQPLTSMFMHGDLLHLAMNMLALWSIGTPIENDIGSKRFTVLYFISGFCGAALVILQGDSIPTVGASGAVVGLLGALAIFYPNSTLLLLFIPMKARTAALVFGVVSLLAAVFHWFAGLSHLGHLGGLIGGLVYSKFAIGNRARSEGAAFMGQAPPHGQAGGPYRPQDRQEVLREMMQQFMRDRNMLRGGRFIDVTDPPTEKHEQEKFKDIDVQRPKKLYYDQASGKFYFD